MLEPMNPLQARYLLRLSVQRMEVAAAAHALATANVRGLDCWRVRLEAGLITARVRLRWWTWAGLGLFHWLARREIAAALRGATVWAESGRRPLVVPVVLTVRSWPLGPRPPKMMGRRP